MNKILLITDWIQRATASHSPAVRWCAGALALLLPGSVLVLALVWILRQLALARARG